MTNIIHEMSLIFQPDQVVVLDQYRGDRLKERETNATIAAEMLLHIIKTDMFTGSSGEMNASLMILPAVDIQKTDP